jgi:enoyl-CoA hydratase/carnithine racemase
MTSVVGVEGRVTLTRDGVIATVSVERPAKLNALTPEMLDELGGAVAECAASDARVVVLRAAGDRAFCVGADIGRFAELAPTQMWSTWTTKGHRVFGAIASLPQPTVAVLHGDAFGGGLELALAADFRVMAEDARLGLPEVGLGTVPGWGGTERLTRLVGPSRAKEICVARRLIDASTALAWGLATSVASSAELDACVRRLLDDIVGGAPVAVRLAKQLIDAAAAGGSSRYLEPLAGAVAATTHDLAEGVAAFRERRNPDFTGH